MTDKTISLFRPVNKLTLTIPNTEFAAYCQEADQLAEREPEILTMIKQDLDIAARRKKRGRMLDKQWLANRNSKLPGVDVSTEVPEIDKITLETGRPRMDAYIVYMFMIGRGYYGGIISEMGKTFTGESTTLQVLLANKGLKMPSANSVYDNINAISNTTRQFIMDAQIRQIIEEDLDDFKMLTADSTSISGNVSWPRDSNLIVQLICRAYKRGKTLHKFELPDIKTRYFPRLIKQAQALSNKINMESGKAKSQKKRRKHYRKLLSLSQEAIILFDKEIANDVSDIDILPTKKVQLSRLVSMISDDIGNLKKVASYCQRRIFEQETILSKDKIMSISDPDAAYIQKGNREANIGYKPQLARSGNGFVSSTIIPKGNLSDASQFKPIIEQSINRTGITPRVVSVDDGYVHTAHRNKLLEKGVEVVSFSGAKGKRLIPHEQWESLAYQDARNDRSAVESLMFTIKYRFDFDRVVRRGVDNVNAELLEKVLAYNFCRIIQIRKQQKMPLDLAA